MANDSKLKKRYWVFGYDSYYPYGGFGDCKFTSDSKEEALNYSEGMYYDYIEVFDSIEREIIKDEH